MQDFRDYQPVEETWIADQGISQKLTSGEDVEEYFQSPRLRQQQVVMEFGARERAAEALPVVEGYVRIRGSGEDILGQ